MAVEDPGDSPVIAASFGAHHIPENKILFNNRIPASVAVDIIRLLNQHVKVFNSTIAIKQPDSLLSGSWTAFPVRFSPDGKY